MLAITLIPALRSTLSQRAQIDALRDQIAGQRQTVAALQQEQRQWADPAYVEQQARERLKLVRVGEKSFTVIEAPAAPVLPQGTKIAGLATDAATSGPWYGQLWKSMVIADTPAKATEGQPSLKPPASPSPSP